MPGFADTLTRLGDSIAGVDPLARFKTRAQVDEIQAQTDASMALARERRIQAEQAEMERAALDRIRATAPDVLNDPNQAPIGDLIVGKRGSDYSGAQQGRLHAQGFNERAIVETPSLGDVAAEANRQAAMDALAPGSAIALRRPPAAGRGGPVIVEGDEGPEYVAPDQAPGRKPAARPLAPRPATPRGPPHEQQVAEWLQSLGVDQDQAVNLALKRGDPRNAYSVTVRALLNQKDAAFRPIYTPDQAADAARSLVEAAFGAGSLERAAGPVVPPESPGGGKSPDNRPPLDSFFK